MKLIATALIAVLTTLPAFGHAGHDHTAAPGGELHHLLWLGVAAAVALAAFALSQRTQRHRGAEKIKK